MGKSIWMHLRVFAANAIVFWTTPIYAICFAPVPWHSTYLVPLKGGYLLPLIALQQDLSLGA